MRNAFVAPVPDFKREVVAREFAAVADAGLTRLATIYHACHHGLCDVGDGRSFEVVNFMEILGEGLGLRAEDLYQRLKLISDIDDLIVETTPLIAEHGLDLDPVRDALFQEFGSARREAPAPRR
jgi:heterodisulfide reductase subunit D